jgi:dihydroorotate dehydrogenase (fumarate)
MMKSCTIEAREGNPEPRYARLPLGGIQSMGLPNLGYREYIRFAAILKEKYPTKPLIASVAGLCAEDFPRMVEAFQASEVDLIEVNLSCPNIPGKPQIAYDFEVTEKVLASISGLGTKPIGLKLPPFYDPAHHAQMASLIRRYGVRFISCINSIGNTLVIDPETETPIIRPKHGLGGLSGAYIKPVALANVRIFYDLLREDTVSIFGVGGVESGMDAFEFLLAGADAVQIGTTFEKQGAECFSRIHAELVEILERKGYASIADAKGKLKFI